MPSWIEHIDVVQAVLIFCIGLISWFSSRTMTLIDRNQKEMFERITKIEKELWMLKGEHEANQIYRKP